MSDYLEIIGDMIDDVKEWLDYEEDMKTNPYKEG